MPSPLICYHSYDQLSWQRPEKIHDTEDDKGQRCAIPVKARMKDGFDMKNYYRYKNVPNPDIDRILSLTQGANDAMWHFQIAEIQDVGKKTYDNWEMAINEKTKIVIVVNPSSMSLFRGTSCRLDCPQDSIFFIPSYVLFKCQDGHIYYANGNTLL